MLKNPFPGWRQLVVNRCKRRTSRDPEHGLDLFKSHFGLKRFLCPSSRSDVTNTNNTEMGSSSANKSCPTPSLLSMEVSSKNVAVWRIFLFLLNVFFTIYCILFLLQRPWQWRAWPWTVWGRRRRHTTWWGEACAMTSRAMSVSL